MKRGFTPIIILVVIAVVVLLSGAYFVLTNKSTINYNTKPIPGWKTYTSTKLGISFQCPETWEEIEYFDRMFCLNGSDMSPTSHEEFVVFVYPNNDRLDLQDWLKKNEAKNTH